MIDSFRISPEYKLWRRQVIYRDGYKCKICDSKKRVEAHHIIPVSHDFEKRLDVDNGISLCFICHRLIRGKELKLAEMFREILKNGVNSGKLLPDNAEDNPEPSIERNLNEGVTTRIRDFHIEQFINKQVKCEICGKEKEVPYYRSQRSKYFLCGSSECRGKLIKKLLTGYQHVPQRINICLNCGVQSKTPSCRNRIKKYCSNKCQLLFEKSQRGWSRNYKECIVCKTTETKHKGNGMCKTCYRMNRYKVSNDSKSAPPERDDIV